MTLDRSSDTLSVLKSDCSFTASCEFIVIYLMCDSVINMLQLLIDCCMNPLNALLIVEYRPTGMNEHAFHVIVIGIFLCRSQNLNTETSFEHTSTYF